MATKQNFFKESSNFTSPMLLEMKYHEKIGERI